MKNSADRGGCYPPRPKAEVDDILREKHTAGKIGFTQIYSVQIWCKKVQTRSKPKANMVNTAFACQFTWGCKF